MVCQWVCGFGRARRSEEALVRLCTGKRTLQLPGEDRGELELAKAYFPRTRFRNRGRPCLAGSCQNVTEALPTEMQPVFAPYGSSRCPQPFCSLPSPPSRQTTSRKETGEPPSPGGAGRGSSACADAAPSLTHLMLLHHFAEAGIPLRDPSVKLGNSHFNCQYELQSGPNRNQTPRRGLRRRLRPSLRR